MTGTKGITTKAYVVREQGGPFVLTDVVLDELQPGEVLVEMKYTGICHTDIVIQQGIMPTGGFPVVLGHEGAGIVRRVGPGVTDKSIVEGGAVLLSFHGCESCRECDAGRLGSCPAMTDRNFMKTARQCPENTGRSTATTRPSPISLPDGTPVHGQFFGQSSLAALAVVTERSVVPLPSLSSSSAEQLRPLAPLSCGYLTGAATVLNVLRPAASESVVILGMGAVGLAALLAARASGVRDIVAVDVVPGKLELARELGATHAINGKEEPELEVAVKKRLPRGADKILDATGVAPLLESAVQALAHGGTLALVGVPPPTAEIKVGAQDLLLSCKKIVGVIEGQSDPKKDIPRLCKLYQEGKFPIDKLARWYKAENLDEAIHDLHSGLVVKPILCWDGAD